MTGEQDAALALRLADRMGQVLRKRDPAIMGGALAEVVSKWLAGHHPEIRAVIEADFIEAIHKLVPVNEKIILDHYGGKWPDKATMNEWRKDHEVSQKAGGD